MNPTTPESGSCRFPSWTWEAVAALFGSLLCLPILSWRFDHDQAIFATIAEAMLDGKVLYRDAWEHKGPGVFYAYALAFLLLGRDLWAVHVFEILGIGAASAGLMRLGRNRLGSPAAGTASALAMPLLKRGWRGSGPQPEGFAIPFVVWGFALWPRPEDGDRLALRCSAAAVLLSVGALFKSPLIFAPAAVVLDRLWIDRTRPGLRGKLRLSCVTAGATALLPLAIVAYYAARGGLSAFLDANVHFPSKYAAPSVGALSWSSLGPACGWLGWLVPPAALGLMAVGLLRGGGVRRGETLRWCAALLAGWAGLFIQAKFWAYHHLILLPYVAGFLGLAFAKTGDARASRVRSWIDRGGTAVAGVLAGLSLLAFVLQRGPEWAALGEVATRRVPEGIPAEVPPAPTEADVARYVRAMTRPDDRLFVFGDRAVLYLLSERPLAGPYPHLLPALAWFLGPEARPRLHAMIERVSEDRPRVVVLSPEILWWYGAHTPRQVLEEHPDAKQFLTDGFRLALRVGGYEIWTALE